jgi:hypothetical protein
MMHIGQKIGVTGRTGSVGGILILMACLVLGCQAANKSVLQSVYTDPQFHFRIICPDSSWTLTDTTGIAEVLVIAKSRTEVDDFVPNVTVSVEHLSDMMTAEEYGEKNRRSLADSGYEILGWGRTVINQQVLYDLECSRTDGSMHLHFRYLCLVKDSMAYVITCTAPEQQYARFARDFEFIVNSFRFI